MLGGLIAGGLGALGGILGGGAQKKAAKKNMALLNGMKTEGMGYIDQGNDTAAGHLGAAGDLWSGLASESGGLSGLKSYADALGLNGQAGVDATRNAFQTGPGYQFAMDQGLGALERRAAAQGRLGSGQTGIDTLQFAQGLANQEWGNWLNNLQSYGNTQAGIYTGALGGQAGSLNNLASLATNTSGQKVDLIGNITNGLMGANNQYAGGQQQQIMGGLGGLASGIGSFMGYR